MESRGSDANARRHLEKQQCYLLFFLGLPRQWEMGRLNYPSLLRRLLTKAMLFSYS